MKYTNLIKVAIQIYIPFWLTVSALAYIAMFIGLVPFRFGLPLLVVFLTFSGHIVQLSVTKQTKYISIFSNVLSGSWLVGTIIHRAAFDFFNNHTRIFSFMVVIIVFVFFLFSLFYYKLIKTYQSPTIREYSIDHLVLQLNEKVEEWRMNHPSSEKHLNLSLLKKMNIKKLFKKSKLDDLMENQDLAAPIEAEPKEKAVDIINIPTFRIKNPLQREDLISETNVILTKEKPSLSQTHPNNTTMQSQNIPKDVPVRTNINSPTVQKEVRLPDPPPIETSSLQNMVPPPEEEVALDDGFFLGDVDPTVVKPKIQNPKPTNSTANSWGSFYPK